MVVYDSSDEWSLFITCQLHLPCFESLNSGTAAWKFLKAWLSARNHPWSRKKSIPARHQTSCFLESEHSSHDVLKLMFSWLFQTPPPHHTTWNIITPLLHYAIASRLLGWWMVGMLCNLFLCANQWWLGAVYVSFTFQRKKSKNNCWIVFVLWTLVKIFIPWNELAGLDRARSNHKLS